MMLLARATFAATASSFALAAALPVAAQTQAAPQTIPGLENYSLPSSQPTATPPLVPVLPVPAPTPTPTGTPALLPAPRTTPRPEAVATPAQRVTSMPRPSPTPSPASTPIPAQASVEPSVAPLPIPAPAASATPVRPAPVPRGASPATPDRSPWWPWALVGLILLGVASSYGWWRRRDKVEQLGYHPVPDNDELAAVAPVAASEVPAAEPDPAAVLAVAAPAMLSRRTPPAAAAERGMLALALRPARAGLNLLSATVDAELTVTNQGRGIAEEIRIGVSLISAHAGQDADLAAIYAKSVSRPATTPFVLEPGESRRVRIVTALPRAAIQPLIAGGRSMFVPLVAINCVYRTSEGAAQTAQAFAVGVERIDSAKLAPFWLDQQPRTHDQVAARPHGAAIQR